VEEDGQRVRLEVAIREFRPPAPDQPAVFLAGAVHIGDRAYYERLQEFLDSRDVVLYESVKPAGLGAPEHDPVMDDAARVKKTERRIRFLAIATEEFRREQGRLPESLDELAGRGDPRIGSLVRLSASDAWGGVIRFVLTDKGPRGFDITSLGADGAEGGEGPARDLRFADQRPLSAEERGGGHALQEEIARSMGLVFQLDAMRHEGANWRNSDMSIDQVQRRLDEEDAGGDMIFTMLDGSSFMAKLATGLLRFIGSTPSGQAMLKLMIVELLGRAEELMGAMPGNMGAMLDVLVVDRNKVVIADLRRVIAEEKGVRTVGIIYGAGHLPDLHERLVGELGYEPAGDQWNTAIDIDLDAAGIPAFQARQIRAMFRTSIDMQLRALKRAKERSDR
jgi:general secretion pathway protein G